MFITAQEILVDHAQLPDRADRAELAPVPAAGAGVREPRQPDHGRRAGRTTRDEGRALAGAITAIMHGEAYRTSAEHAAHLGPFDGFALNREPMLRVMEMHRDAVEAIDPIVPRPICWPRRRDGLGRVPRRWAAATATATAR